MEDAYRKRLVVDNQMCFVGSDRYYWLGYVNHIITTLIPLIEEEYARLRDHLVQYLDIQRGSRFYPRLLDRLKIDFRSARNISSVYQTKWSRLLAGLVTNAIEFRLLEKGVRSGTYATLGLIVKSIEKSFKILGPSSPVFYKFNQFGCEFIEASGLLMDLEFSVRQTRKREQNVMEKSSTCRTVV